MLYQIIDFASTSHQSCITSVSTFFGRWYQVGTQQNWDEVDTTLCINFVSTLLIFLMQVDTKLIHHRVETKWYWVDSQMCINFVSTLCQLYTNLCIYFISTSQGWYKVDTKLYINFASTLLSVCSNSESTFQESWYTTELKQSCINFLLTLHQLCINSINYLWELLQSWYTTELGQSWYKIVYLVCINVVSTSCQLS